MECRKEVQGWQDSPLTELGIRQATWLRDALQSVHFEAIYSSPSPGASKTSEILRGQHACEVVHHNDLREIFMSLASCFCK